MDGSCQGCAAPALLASPHKAPFPSPAQLRAPMLDLLWHITAVLALGDPEWAQSFSVVFPVERERLPPLIPLTALLPVQPSMGC